MNCANRIEPGHAKQFSTNRHHLEVSNTLTLVLAHIHTLTLTLTLTLPLTLTLGGLVHGVLDKNDMLTLKVTFDTTDEDKSGTVDMTEFKVGVG